MSLRTKILGLVGAVMFGLVGVAGAQDEPPPAEPAPPVEGEPAAEPAPDAPADPSTGDPAPSDAPPGSDGMGDSEEEDAELDEPTDKDDGSAKIGIGARVRYVTIPSAILDLFVDASVPMKSVGFGLEVVRRKRDFDIVFGLEYEKTSPEDGFWLEKGETPGEPGENPDFNEFEDLALLSVDASFIWHKNFNDKVALRYGAGIGLGLVLGKMFQTDTECAMGAAVEECVVPPSAPREESEDVPPVVPIVNVLLGLRVKASEQISFNVEGGFRDMLYIGGGATYFF